MHNLSYYPFMNFRKINTVELGYNKFVFCIIFVIYSTLFI